jgi:lipopolysaccharide export system protein LptA
MNRWLAVGIVLLALWTGGLSHAAALPGTLRADAPVSVTSDRLEADDKLHQVRFLGNVVARQGDVAIYAQELVLVYPDKGKDIDRIEASGAVRIVQGNRVATGEKATFFNRERKIVLTGSPRVYQGDDFLEGDEIIVLLDEEKSIVKSDHGSRVNAVFHPKGERP